MNEETTDQPISFREVNLTLRQMQATAAERNKNTVEGIKEIINKIDAITLNYTRNEDFAAFRHIVEVTYATKDEFNPVRMVAYGLVVTMTSAILLAAAYFIQKR